MSKNRSDHLCWCPVCCYKWQKENTTTNSRNERFIHMGTWASPGTSVRKKCHICKPVKDIGKQICKDLGII